MTIRDDIAVELKRLRKERDLSFKDVVNEALEQGVERMRQKPKRKTPFKMKTVDLGPLLYPSVKDALQAMDEEYDRKKLGLP
jgi:hypothetical protein